MLLLSLFIKGMLPCKIKVFIYLKKIINIHCFPNPLQIFYSISILFLFLETFPQQMQVHRQTSDRNSLHVTGRESGTSFQEQIPRLPTVPLSRRSPSWPSRLRLGGAPASSSGSYQSKLEEHMLTGTALCVQPLFSQQQNKAGPWQEA